VLTLTCLSRLQEHKAKMSAAVYACTHVACIKAFHTW
jgi:hypothetical protein